MGQIANQMLLDLLRKIKEKCGKQTLEPEKEQRKEKKKR